ncbi:formyl transferase [Flavobacteriaceae bacterium Ap0902]|nr:formyl transferase [Flavobacteriaceae bacterium Ap0902]
MSPIVVITYDYPHRKTQDVISGLKMHNYQKVMLLALPFVFRENPFKPIYNHRPSQAFPIYPQELARNLGYDFKKVESRHLAEILDEMKPTATLVAGAGLLPKELVLNHAIINSHPAYLPDIRGLDALKWAIYYKKKIGVTSHIINDKTDAGWLIDRVEIPIYENDTFHAVAYRQYETEIKMLIEAIDKIKNKGDLIALEEKGEAHRRMPKKIEQDLLSYFNEYIKIFSQSKIV